MPSPRRTLVLVGGPDVGLRARMVQELRHRFDICVLGSDRLAEATFRGLGIEYRFYNLSRGISPWRDLMTVVALFRHLRSLRPQVVHTYDSKPSALGRIAAWMARVPVIIGTLPGMGSLYGSNTVQTRLARPLYELTQKIASRLADLTIVQNEDDLRDLVSRGVVPASKGLLIRGSGVDTEAFRPGRLELDEESRMRATLGLADNNSVVTMVARVIRSKGVLEYAAAARTIREAWPETRFLLIGSRDERNPDSLDAMELAAVGDAVECLGERADVADVLAVTDVFVLPSVYMEGIPRAVMEAAACGLPIVTTDVRGCRDVVEDGVSGLLIRPGDVEGLVTALRCLLGDSGMRATLGLRAREVAVSAFDLRVIAAQLQDVYLGPVVTAG